MVTQVTGCYHPGCAEELFRARQKSNGKSGKNDTEQSRERNI